MVYMCYCDVDKEVEGMRKHRTQVMLDEDLYQGLKKLPREVSISAFINMLLKMAIEEVKMGREMTKDELEKWMRSDPERLKIRMHFKETLDPYFDLIDETMAKVRGKFKKDKK